MSARAAVALYSDRIAKEATQEQVLEAARSLDGDEFTREDVAEKLGQEISAMQPSWKAAKEAGKLVKVDAEKRVFKLADG